MWERIEREEEAQPLEASHDQFLLSHNSLFLVSVSCSCWIEHDLPRGSNDRPLAKVYEREVTEGESYQALCQLVRFLNLGTFFL